MMEIHLCTWLLRKATLLLLKNWLPMVQTCLSQQQMEQLRSTWHANLIGVILWTISSMPTWRKYLRAKVFKQSIPSYSLPHFCMLQPTHHWTHHWPFHSRCNCLLASSHSISFKLCSNCFQPIHFALMTTVGKYHYTLLVESVLPLKYFTFLCRNTLQHFKLQTSVVVCHYMLLVLPLFHHWMPFASWWSKIQMQCR